MLADEVLSVGTNDHTPVYPREIVKRAPELSPTARTLAHNPPSGDPTPPSPAIRTTTEDRHGPTARANRGAGRPSSPRQRISTSTASSP